MKNNQDNSRANFDEDSIDIISILRKIWSERKLIFKTTLFFFIAGCIISLLSPTVYTSETTFVPQVSDDKTSSVDDGLGSLASLAGINLNRSKNISDSYLSPLLYSKLVESEEFSQSIINEEITNLKGDKSTIKAHILSTKNSFSLNPFNFVKKYTVGLFLNNNSEKNNKDVLKNYNFLSDEDYNIIISFRKKFKVEVYEKEGYIKVLATDKDAFISTQIVEIVTRNLQSDIIKLRTNKIKERLKYSKEQYELKQQEFDILQKKLAEFIDSNKNISTASFRSQLQKLESEFQLQQNILINLASEYNNNKIKLNKDTPIFSVLNQVSIPNERTSPKRSLMVIIYIFLGLTLSISFILGKKTIADFIKEIRG